MRKLILLSAVTSILVFIGGFDANACTGFRLKAKDGGIIYGRSMEWGAFDLNTRITLVPRGYTYKGLTPDGNNGKEYVVKYGMVGLDMPAIRDGYISDGMNEKGLAIGMFYHPEFTKYPGYIKSEVANTISGQEVTNYILSQFANIDEVKEGIRKVRVVGVMEESINLVPGMHWMVTDTDGNSIVIEYNDGEIRIHDAPLGVITNAPNYDWHMTNLQNFVSLSENAFPAKKLEEGVELRATGAGSGLLGLPGDNTPPSRFIRAVTWTQTARPFDNAEEGIYEAFRILDNFQLPLGPDAAEGSGHGENNDLMRSSTIWTVAWNLEDLTLNYHTQHNRRVRRLSISEIDFSKMGKEIVYIPLDEKKEQDIKEINPKL
jgi:choloylglycine hydrolase